MKISKRIALLCPLLLLVSGCIRTISPNITKAKQASFSPVADPAGNYQTSGVWGWRTNNHGLVIDHVGRDSYNSLIARGWGAKLTPPVTNQDAGVTPYTNNPVEPLRGVNGKLTKAVPNPGLLYEMNPFAEQAWPNMNTLSRAPMAPAPSRPP